MFYLIQFFKFILIKGTRGYLFVFFSLLMVGGGAGRVLLDEMIGERFRLERPLPYFHALVTGEKNIESLLPRITSIPGVKKVKSKEAGHLQRQAKELLVDLGLGELHQEDQSLGLQIFLGHQVQAKTYALVKEYMTRLLGKTQVVAGALKRPEMTFLKTKEMSITFLQRWGSWLALSTIGLLWLLSLLSIGPDFGRYCYVLEEYQRRKNIGAKVMGLGILGLAVISLGGFLLFEFEKIHYHSAATLLLAMLILSCTLCIRKRWGQ